MDRGLDDVIQLAEIISVADQVFGIGSDKETYEQVANTILLLVSEGLAEVGELVPDGPTLLFSAWDGDAEMIVDRVLRDWKQLGRDPGLGEVCWLALTDDGRSKAEELALGI